MHRNANATPHANAINQADPGFAEIGNAGIHGVFFREKRLHRRAISGDSRRAHGTHIATGAKGPSARAFQQRKLYGSIMPPIRNGGGEAADHFLIERIQRLGPVHQNCAGGAFACGNQAGFGGFGHRKNLPKSNRARCTPCKRA